MQTSFDYIIIGAGSSGSVLASRLSEDPGLSVLLIEAGPPDNVSEIDMPEAWPTLMGSDRDWAFASTPQHALGGRQIALPRGRTLGGSSSTNVMLYVHGDATDYDSWELPGWTSDGFASLFSRLETYTGSPLTSRGTSGPLKITKHDAPTADATRFLKAAEALGHRENTDYNSGKLTGAAHFQSTIFEGRRQSASRAFLNPVRDRSNLTILTGGVVERVLIRDGRATGIEASLNGRPTRFSAREEIVLSAGAIGSPWLLLRSGIGSADDLLAAGIPVRVDLPAVGRNLSDHPLVSLGFRADCVSPMGHSGVEAVLFGRFDSAHDGAPDYQISFGSFLLFPPEMTGGGTGCTLGVTICRPKSQGALRLDPVNPNGPPLIDSGFLSSSQDIDALERTLFVAESLAAQAGWKGLVTPAGDTSSARRGFIRGTLGSNHHAAGTCRMGDGSDAVVGPDLRVHGVAGLRIADASIMPKLVSGNPNATVLAIGMKAADLILGNHEAASAAVTELEKTS